MLPKGKRLRYHLGIIFLLSLVASISTSRIIQAQPINNFAVFKITSSQDIQQLINFGNQHYQFGQYENAIAAWLQALERQGSKTYTLALHNNLAKAYQQLGNISSAITHRQVVIKVYRQERKYLQLASLLVDQAQAYHSLGQFHNAIRLVEEVLAYDLSGDRKIAVVAQGVLGNTYISIGEYDKAFSAYSQSLQLANAIGNLNYQVTALNNLFQIH